MPTAEPIPTPPAPKVSPSGILFISASYPGASLRIQHGALVVDLGGGRVTRVSRASRPRLRRLVILGRGGWWSFEVAHWLAAIGARWVLLGRDGRPLGSGPDGISPDNPRLRAAQATAPLVDVGLEICRRLVVEKLGGQRRCLADLLPDEDAEATIQSAEAAAAAAATLDELRGYEAAGAAAYWRAWEGRVSLRFARLDAPRVPPTWHGFQGRTSALTGDPQHATGPTNALLNLAYGLLLAETTIALRMVGLDPGLPLGLHAAQPNRANAALDVLEPCRPVVDRLVLELVGRHVFTRRDFIERPNGTVRISARIIRSLVEMTPELAGAVASPAESVAQHLADSVDLGTLSTPLTGARRSDGRSRHRGSTHQSRRRRNRDAGVTLAPASTWRLTLPKVCEDCGTPVTANRTRCATCHTAANTARLAARRSETWRAVQANERYDSSHGGEAAAKRGDSIRRRRRLQELYEASAGSRRPVPEVFQSEILPGLRLLSLGTISRETGLSLAYCSQIRAGKRIPHPRHWPTMRFLTRGATEISEG